MCIGYVRVTNRRIDMAPDNQPEEGEVVIRVDRSNPILGNRHHMRERSQSERARVIEAYQTDLEEDQIREGPMYQAILAIAERVLGGERICLECHCVPLDCHGDLIAKRINEVVQDRLRNHPREKE